MKKLGVLILFMALLSADNVSSQIREGDNLFGGSLGFWPTGEVPTFGINFGSNITQAGIGTVGLGGIFRYYSYSFVYGNGDSRRYSFSSLGFQTNYNFNQIGNGRFVPYLGVVIGYNYVNTTYTDVSRNAVYITDVTYRSGAWLWGQAGFRYFFSPSVAGSVRAGFGNHDFNTFELGMDFKL
ncbi:MAG: hypothetical protein L0Y79_12615 [Chlorobi bacterium]|nr:hypothetical protein [Chlorobiota bacterium]MCI0715519.1 hypothetical protein [Chlorobiota bacterium]